MNFVVNVPDERLQEVADQLQAALEKEFECRFGVKENSLLHKNIAKAFDVADLSVNKVRELASFLSIDVPQFGLPTGKQYLSEFGTTVGADIDLPVDWYKPEKATTRILVGPHEAGHARQFKKGVDAGWWPKVVSFPVLYLASVITKDAAEFVGKVEADQYGTTEAVREWMGGKGGRRPIEEIGESLRRHYALMNAGVSTAQAILRSHYRAMDNGGVPNVDSAEFTIDWLETHAPDLKGVVLT
jgi:hypothetical protein